MCVREKVKEWGGEGYEVIRQSETSLTMTFGRKINSSGENDRKCVTMRANDFNGIKNARLYFVYII